MKRFLSELHKHLESSMQGDYLNNSNGEKAMSDLKLARYFGKNSY
jgi:hypothetical protein